MSNTPQNPRSAKPLSTWVSEHFDYLRRSYGGQYIAFNLEGVIAHGEDIEQVYQDAKDKGVMFSVYRVPTRSAGSIFAPAMLHVSCK